MDTMESGQAFARKNKLPVEPSSPPDEAKLPEREEDESVTRSRVLLQE